MPTPPKRERRKTVRVDRPEPKAALPKDRCTLTMLTGPTPGAIQPVTPHGPLILGRDDKLPARIADRGVSGEHARIWFDRGSFWIEDLDSTNGTYVNSETITTPHMLQDGDRIQLGENTLIRVSLQDETEQEAARKMYTAAVHDPLTGVFNRGHLDAMLVCEFAYAERHSFPLSILFMDLDHFTAINNGHGHQAGDAVLRATAQAIRKCVRLEDMVARYGGEELVVVARNIDSDGALIMAERVRRMIESVTVSHNRVAIRVTASIGVATHETATPYDNVEQLIAAADRAVYLAKADGRNCVRRAYDKAPQSWRAPPMKR